jgi:hypothetical protein
MAGLPCTRGTDEALADVGILGGPAKETPLAKRDDRVLKKAALPGSSRAWGLSAELISKI